MDARSKSEDPAPSPRRIDEEVFVARVTELGLADAAHSAHASRATLQALGECLPEPERTALIGALPGRLASAVAPFRGLMAVEEFLEREHEHEGTTAGFAREHAEIVCRVLGEMLPEEVTLRISRAVTPSVAALFTPPEDLGEPPLHGVPHTAKHHSLATGAPGSHHPLSESRPPGSQGDSVAATSDPHGDRKLSGATGLTQEQTHESLATEVPDTDRTIAESHD